WSWPPPVVRDRIGVVALPLLRTPDRTHQRLDGGVDDGADEGGQVEGQGSEGGHRTPPIPRRRSSSRISRSRWSSNSARRDGGVGVARLTTAKQGRANGQSRPQNAPT